MFEVFLSCLALSNLLLQVCCEPGLIDKNPNYTFVHNATSAPAENSFYDYIIVGGGTAGCPLAATLSQNFTVLLLERGGLPYTDPDVQQAVGYTRIQVQAATTPTSAGQRFISEDGVVSLRANVLGGGSAVNAGFFTYASDEDVRSFGWDRELVKASYAWVARVVAGFPTLGPWQEALRRGLVEAGVAPDKGDTYRHVLGTKVGGSIFDANAHRHTAADLLQYADPARLTVYIHAYASRILLRNASSQTESRHRQAHGVEYKDLSGAKHVALLRPGGEVVLSAGALGSPQLLLLSGIGPASKLAEFGIRQEVELEGVGEGMADNPKNSVFVPSPSPVEGSFVQVVGSTGQGNIFEGASGSGTLVVAGGIDLSSLPPGERSLERVQEFTLRLRDLSLSPHAPSVQGGFILQKLYRPRSSGWLKLRSADVMDSPLVRFNYYEDPEDLRSCVDGIRVVDRVVRTKGFLNFTYGYGQASQRLSSFPDLAKRLLPGYMNDTRRLEKWCKDTVSTIWHFHGGCRVGSVVDSRHLVKGVDSLRVVDGSAWTVSPGANPQATVMMLGRYMGVQILKHRLGKEIE